MYALLRKTLYFCQINIINAYYTLFFINKYCMHFRNCLKLNSFLLLRIRKNPTAQKLECKRV